MSQNTEPGDAGESVAWRVLGQWPVIALASIVILILTLNPLLTGFLPYVRAGWPAARTAIWLKKVDPWKARGTVGFLFHLCMALFRAGAWAFLSVLVTAIVANVTQQQPDLIPFVIAISIIAFGCCLSSIIGLIGIAMALTHGVRIFVMSNLFTVCHGHFNVARTLEPSVTRTNPVNFLIGIVIATPLLGIWFTAMRYTAPGVRIGEADPTQTILLCLLPVLALFCIAVLYFLSRKIAAQSPAECWGTGVLDSQTSVVNWNQPQD